MRWPTWIGIGSRLAAESVADFHRNRWPACRGIRNLQSQKGIDDVLHLGVAHLSVAVSIHTKSSRFQTEEDVDGALNFRDADTPAAIAVTGL